MKIRPGNLSDVPEISRVFAQSWKTTYEGLVPDSFLKGMSEEAGVKLFATSLQPNEYSYFLHVAETPEGRAGAISGAGTAKSPASAGGLGPGRIVGFCDGGKERSHPESGMGELYAIYLLKEFQGQGIGRNLFQAAARSLVQSGITSMIVWVLEQSPYRKFYESVGGKLEPGIKRLDVANQQVKLVPYRWPDLNLL